MGYISDVALHVKGSEERFIKIQREYFCKLRDSEVRLWAANGSNTYEVQTFHETKESYVNAGQCIWNHLGFQPTDSNCMVGSLFWQDHKWLRYYSYQCEELLKILTGNNYSWYYIHCGENDRDLFVRNNEEKVSKFHFDVLVPYILDHEYSRPRLLASKKIL